MRSLIMDLLDFTKIRLDRKEEKIQEVNLAEVASEAIVTVQPYAIQMDVTINLDVRSDAVIMADPDDMEIVFNNLISNAVKYNKVGGKAEITIDSSDSEAIMIFSDTGIGITRNDTENLFTEFVRIKNEKTRNISGSGLGLSIVKKVVELYHGTINVDSTPDVGTVFTIRLPKKQLNIA
jgi:two-component system, sensor histidine kinase and response regulator